MLSVEGRLEPLKFRIQKYKIIFLRATRNVWFRLRIGRGMYKVMAAVYGTV